MELDKCPICSNSVTVTNRFFKLDCPDAIGEELHGLRCNTENCITVPANYKSVRELFDMWNNRTNSRINRISLHTAEDIGALTDKLVSITGSVGTSSIVSAAYRSALIGVILTKLIKDDLLVREQDTKYVDIVKLRNLHAGVTDRDA